MSLVTLTHVGMWDLPGPGIEFASPALAGTSKASTCNAAGMGSISGLEDPLEEERATHSSILAWEIPWTEKPGGRQSIGSQTVDATEHTYIIITTEPPGKPPIWLC